MPTAFKGGIDSNTIIAGNLKPHLQQQTDPRQKIKKETQALNDILNQINLSSIYRALHLKAAEYTFSSSAHRAFYKRGHRLGHKASFDKFKKTEITSSIFSNHNTMRLEIDYKKKKTRKHKHMKVITSDIFGNGMTQERNIFPIFISFCDSQYVIKAELVSKKYNGSMKISRGN